MLNEKSLKAYVDATALLAAVLSIVSFTSEMFVIFSADVNYGANFALGVLMFITFGAYVVSAAFKTAYGRTGGLSPTMSYVLAVCWLANGVMMLGVATTR